MKLTKSEIRKLIKEVVANEGLYKDAKAFFGAKDATLLSGGYAYDYVRDNDTKTITVVDIRQDGKDIPRREWQFGPGRREYKERAEIAFGKSSDLRNYKIKIS